MVLAMSLDLALLLLFSLFLEYPGAGFYPSSDDGDGTS
jgi:hypothetical protein